MLNLSAKQDGVYTRTAAQYEQKAGLGKRFAEVMGIATDARDTADEAKKAVSELDGNLTSEEIYNRLTDNGRLQGLYRDNDGNLYVNAEFIVALEKLFAKDITMSGTFTHKAMVFLEPEQEEVKTIQNHLIETEFITPDKIPLYDFSNDGEISLLDLAKAQRAALGIESLESWSGAVKTEVTLTIDMSDPDKFIRITGTNMWGRQIDKYIGVNATNINSAVKDFVIESGNKDGWTYRKWYNGDFECWCSYTKNVDAFVKAGNVWFANWDVTLPFVSTTMPVASGSSRWYFGNWVNVTPETSEVESNTTYSKVTVMLYQTQDNAGPRQVFLNVKGRWK